MPKTEVKLKFILDEKIEEGVELAPYTSFGIGGRARYFMIAENTSQLVRAIRAARESGIKFFVLGSASPA